MCLFCYSKKTAETNARIVQKKMLLAAKRKGFSSRRGLGSGHVKGGWIVDGRSNMIRNIFS